MFCETAQRGFTQDTRSVSVRQPSAQHSNALPSWGRRRSESPKHTQDMTGALMMPDLLGSTSTNTPQAGLSSAISTQQNLVSHQGALAAKGLALLERPSIPLLHMHTHLDYIY